MDSEGHLHPIPRFLYNEPMRKSGESDAGKWAPEMGRVVRTKRAARSTTRAARIVSLVVALGLILVGIQSLGLPGVSFSLLDPFDFRGHRQAQSLLSSLSVEEKCATVLLVAFGNSPQMTVEFASHYQRIPVGGILFFAYNIPKTVDALLNLTDGIQDSVSEVRSRGTAPFLAIDHEGGTVMRLKGLVTELPDARELGRSKAPIEKIQHLFRIVPGTCPPGVFHESRSHGRTLESRNSILSVPQGLCCGPGANYATGRVVPEGNAGGRNRGGGQTLSGKRGWGPP